MASTGCIARLIQPLAAAAVMIGLSACGGGGDESTPFPPPAPSPVALTIGGLPSAALLPGQSAQLTATLSYTDASSQDVTATATWSTTNAAVLTVSSSGVVAAVAPGQGEVVAAAQGLRSQVNVSVVPPAAYFANDLESAFDYTLDAQGRVDSYRIGELPPECAGSLHGSFECARVEGGYHSQTLRGELGRITEASCVSSDWCQSGLGSVKLSYGPFGLAGIVSSYEKPPHGRAYAETTITYDDAGRLSVVTVKGTGGYCYIVCPDVLSTSQITLDSQGRLLHANTTVIEKFSTGERERQILTDWRYDAAGYMTEVVSTSPTGTESDVWRFVVDPNGWLVSRFHSAATDAYAVTRTASGVVEEEFTLAEPWEFSGRLFYRRAAQRVRYEAGRLPSQPLFVPRAFDGRSASHFIATAPIYFLPQN